MQSKLSKTILSFALTLGLLIFFEIITSAFLPALGWSDNRIAFPVVIILFLAIKLNSPMVAWFILALQLVHSVFSIEGWALGTMAGITAGIVAGYIKEVLDFSTPLLTMITVQIFQVFWFLFITIVISLKVGSFDHFASHFFSALPGTIILSVMSPGVFFLLDKIWSADQAGTQRGVSL